MSTGGYSAWVWSPEHQRHYCYRYVNGQIEYQWSGPPARTAAPPTSDTPRTTPLSQTLNENLVSPASQPRPTLPTQTTRTSQSTPATRTSQTTPATRTSQSTPAARTTQNTPVRTAQTRTAPAARTTSARTNSYTPAPTAAKPEEPEEEDEDEEEEPEGGDDNDDENDEDDEDDEAENSGGEENQPAAAPQPYRPTAATQHQSYHSRPQSYPYNSAQSTAATQGSTHVSPSASPQYTFQRPTYSSSSQPPVTQQTQEVAATPKNRHIKTSFAEVIESKEESLDPRYKRVSARHIPQFFCRGRVFKMLWTEPAGVTPGKTRGSTHFSLVRFSETAYSEIRRFIVISNKGQYSQCIPIQTYRGQGTRKRGVIVNDHTMVYTGEEGDDPPDLIPGEQITKQALRVKKTSPDSDGTLEPASRVNFGKVYTVEHNVKVLDIGIVAPEHIYLLMNYFQAALTSV